MERNNINISAVIITFNEENNIGRCLTSLQKIADEIVVVDSFSTDNTEEICRQFGAKFIQHTFQGHIEQKNYALSQTTFDHVLSLDADEVLSEKLAESIMEIKSSWDADAYSFNRLTNYCGKWIRYSGWYPDRKIRLLDRRKGRWGGINPHDRIVMIKGSMVKFLKGDLLHYSVNSVEQHLQTINSFSSIAAKAKFERGEKAGLLKIIFNPLWKFIRNYFLKRGFLDGYYGFVIVTLSAYGTFLRYIKLREHWLQRKKQKEQL